MQPTVGDLLIAPPQILDPRFRESVVLLASAGHDGHWGLCLNRPTGTSTLELFRNLGLDHGLDSELYWGGPVSQGVIWMLHDQAWRMDNTIILDDQWAMTSHREMFEILTEEGTPEHFRLFSGFAAWAPGQLEGEIAGTPPWTQQSSWLVCHSLGPQWSFASDDHDLWTACISLSSQQAVREWMT
jgi:putative transcriptional regulator